MQVARRHPVDAASLGGLAAAVLADEARLTPKPGLVDRRGSGSHADLDLDLMLRSAAALRGAFAAMALRAAGERPGQRLREDLAAIGREGERAMLAATGGANSHRGAIWTLGLLVAGAAMDPGGGTPAAIAARAAALARLRDRFAPRGTTNGARARAHYGVAGAPGEAAAGFPHVVAVGLPALRRARGRCVPEESARLDALLAIMSSLDDTCLLHRGGLAALEAAQAGARAALALGGAAAPAGRRAVLRLDAELLARNASPGGSADCLAAVLFLDRLCGVARSLAYDEGIFHSPSVDAAGVSASPLVDAEGVSFSPSANAERVSTAFLANAEGIRVSPSPPAMAGGEGWGEGGPRPHDLLEIASADSLVHEAPPAWLAASLARAPFVVVRRAAGRGALLPVGVRGALREERFAAWLPASGALRVVRPEDLAAARAWRRRRRSPQLAALDAVEDAMAALRLRWGPTGSAGFELATGIACLTPASDLDVVARAPVARSRDELRSLQRALSRLPVRVDVLLETPRGAVALAELAAGPGRVLLRTAEGPLLAASPWEAPGLAAGAP